MASTLTHKSTLTLLFSTLLLTSPLPSLSSDPDPLQDFCIADLQAPVSMNGFPCKPASNVTSNDFFFDGLAREGDTYILAFVHNEKNWKSELQIVNAKTMKLEATVKLPKQKTHILKYMMKNHWHVCLLECIYYPISL